MSCGKCSVAIVPCSGIGKPFGTASREAAYEVCEELRPAETHLVALAKLVMGDSAAQQTVAQAPVVTIDGCAQRCAAKMVEQNGGVVAHEASVLDAYRRHKELKPDGIAELNEAGRRLAHVLAEEIAEVVDGIVKPCAAKGGRNG